MKILVYGFGNPGRRDDGLGNELVRLTEDWAGKENLTYINFDSNYQLNIEDADALAAHDVVIFADASTEEQVIDFMVTRVDGVNDVSFTSHSASPGYILQLARDIYGKDPLTLLIHIRGYKWEFKEGLSRNGKANLKKAMEWLKPRLLNPDMLKTSNFN